MSFSDGRGGHPFGNQARREAGSLEQRLENLILWGKVEQRDEAAIKVRVRFGNPEDPYSVLSPWIPIGEKSAHQTRETHLPDINELVVVMNSSGMLENGFVLCSIPYRDEENDEGFPFASKDGEVERKIWGPVKVLGDLVKYCFHTFNRMKAELWHYFTDGGIFRFEIGKNTKTNTYFHMEDGRIELRVGTTKFLLTEAGINAFYSGNAVSLSLDVNGVTVGLRKDHKYAPVPDDKYEGTEGESKGDGVTSVNDIQQTTLRLVNGQAQLTMDDKVQMVVTPDLIVSTLKDRAQHVITKNLIESSVLGAGGAKTASLTINPDTTSLELHGATPMRMTLNAASQQLELLIKQSRLLLTPAHLDLRIPGVSCTFVNGQWIGIASDFAFIKGTASGATWQPASTPTGQVQMASHPDTEPPDDLPRPEIELGVNPHTPEM